MPGFTGLLNYAVFLVEFRAQVQIVGYGRQHLVRSGYVRANRTRQLLSALSEAWANPKS